MKTDIDPPSDSVPQTLETPMKGHSTRPHSNPYLIGAGLGVLSWAAFALVNQPLGVSTSLSAASGACLAPFIGWEQLTQITYWAKTAPSWDYGMLFLVGTALGAFFSALLSGRWKLERVPTLWAERFGTSAAKRMLFAFLGGIVIMFGARMAGGCTSGHGISGSLQFALSSWIFFITMFIAGVVTAGVMFRKSRNTGTGGAI